MKSAKYYKDDILPNKMKIEKVVNISNSFQYNLSDKDKIIIVNESYIDDLMEEYYKSQK